MRGIQELHCGVAIERVMGALAQGACPGLRKLVVGHEYLSDPVVDHDGCRALSIAMQSGRCHDLRELTMKKMDATGITMVLLALQNGACPHLTKLDLTGSIRAACDWMAMEVLIVSRACPDLQVLRLNEALSGGSHLFSVIQALQKGCCPHLLELGVRGTEISLATATALARLVSSNVAINLECLDLSQGGLGWESTTRLLDEMMTSGQQLMALRHLDLSACGGVDPQHGLKLGQLLKSLVFPNLEVLLLGGNYRLGDPGVAHVVTGLGGGEGIRLRKLDLRYTGAGPSSAAALIHAFESGSFVQLESLSLADNRFLGDEAMAKVVSYLKHSHSLRELNFESSGMGTQTCGIIHQALLEEGVWPNLCRLEVEYTSGDCICDLASVLGVKGVANRLKELHILCTEGSEGRHLLELADAFRRGACWSLRELVVWEDIPEIARVELRRALHGRAVVTIF